MNKTSKEQVKRAIRELRNNQLSAIRAVLLLNADDLDKLLAHMQWEYPKCPSTWEHHDIVNGADTQC